MSLSRLHFTVKTRNFHTAVLSSSSGTMMRAVCVDKPGGPETMKIRSVPRPEPGPGQVLIQVHTAALNRADLLQRRGLYPPPPGESEVLGLEVSGTVVQTGSGLQSGLRPSDRVMALLGGGGYAEYVVVPEVLVLPIPRTMSLTEAAAIPEVWITAFQLLHRVALVQPGEVVLVHAGASGVGSAAVQMVRLCGAVPIVTVGTKEKLDLTLSLGAETGFNYREEQWEEGVKEYTQGRGADVILDCVGALWWSQNVDALAVDGRWVLYGTLGGSRVQGPVLSRLLSKRGSLLSSMLRPHRLEYKASLVRSFSKVLPLFSSKLRAVVDSEFSLEQACEAHRRMEQNQNLGKILLRVQN